MPRKPKESKSKAPRKTTKSKAKKIEEKKKLTTEEPKAVEQEVTPSKDKKLAISKKNLKYVLILFFFALLLGTAYYYRGIFVAAMVNNTPVFRSQVIKELEKQAGAQVLDTIITQNLIDQKAKEENITVSEEEINTQLREIEESLQERGLTLDAALEAQGLSREDVVMQIKSQKLLEKLIADRVAVTDEEVDTYIEENKDIIGGEDVNTEEIKPQVREQLEQQKFQEQVQLYLSELKEEANIMYFVQY